MVEWMDGGMTVRRALPPGRLAVRVRPFWHSLVLHQKSTTLTQTIHKIIKHWLMPLPMLLYVRRGLRQKRSPVKLFDFSFCWNGVVCRASVCGQWLRLCSDCTHTLARQQSVSSSSSSSPPDGCGCICRLTRPPARCTGLTPLSHRLSHSTAHSSGCRFILSLRSMHSNNQFLDTHSLPFDRRI